MVDKPAGLVVHPAAGNLDSTLVNAAAPLQGPAVRHRRHVARPGIVHRIDKDTSGLLVVAKTDAAHEGWPGSLQTIRSIEPIWRSSRGQPIPPAGTVTGAIARSNANRKKMALVEDGRGKHAVTHYKVSNSSTMPRWSNAGWKPGGRIRCAFTWRQSAIR
ncbi:MAG: pseudouridine synthase [Novosphingobium sp.]